jgi:hypothetical protein
MEALPFDACGIMIKDNGECSKVRNKEIWKKEHCLKMNEIGRKQQWTKHMYPSPHLQKLVKGN